MADARPVDQIGDDAARDEEGRDGSDNPCSEGNDERSAECLEMLDH